MRTRTTIPSSRSVSLRTRTTIPTLSPSIISLATTTATITTTAIITAISVATLTGYDWLCNLGLSIKCLTALAWENISTINPDLDTNNAKSCMRFGTVIIDIGTQSLQRNFALYLFLCTGNFCSAQASRNDYFDAFSIGTH